MANIGQNTPVKIAVMGVTGSGKSTFIQTATPESEVGIGHDLESFTAMVEAFRFEHKGRQIELIDTPGFNDTTRSETEVLREIADWLDATYRNPPHERLNGIIYLQSIMDPRMYGSSLRNLKMFKDLCGENPMKNVMLVTTRWGVAKKAGSEEIAADHENQLQSKEEFWEPMVRRGANLARFEDTKESALSIIDLMINQKPIVLQIQSELVDDGKNLIETTAGYTLNQEIISLKSKYAEELAQVQKEMEIALAAREHDVAEALKASELEFQRKIDRVTAEQEILQYERRNETRRWQNELQSQRAYFEQQLEKLGGENLNFEETVKKLKENEAKLRKEQREAMQAEIDAMKKKPKKDRTAVKLLLALLPTVGSIVLALLGLSPGVMLSGLGC
ncbi:P-loop containing nucleoside triphosphate hydrolase protein [Acrodontium crateriforme]|uniref:P-loop containing nucleoside triphosphate hydrolase protein n=1 Tax=Acrodontium crateriforme TaxID=150365 RepID=A0AAQ3R5J0_9PEZI|nr:P-loop containing nucleoside triphosphate hydrolase protein [Acrodontium crateriforme]